MFDADIDCVKVRSTEMFSKYPEHSDLIEKALRLDGLNLSAHDR